MCGNVCINKYKIEIYPTDFKLDYNYEVLGSWMIKVVVRSKLETTVK